MGGPICPTGGPHRGVIGVLNAPCSTAGPPGGLRLPGVPAAKSQLSSRVRLYPSSRDGGADLPAAEAVWTRSLRSVRPSAGRAWRRRWRRRRRLRRRRRRRRQEQQQQQHCCCWLRMVTVQFALAAAAAASAIEAPRSAPVRVGPTRFICFICVVGETGGGVGGGAWQRARAQQSRFVRSLFWLSDSPEVLRLLLGLLRRLGRRCRSTTDRKSVSLSL